MLWFVLIQMPVLMLSLTMTVDYTRIYLAHRQVTNAAQAAAQAGAQQIAPGTSTLVQSGASSATAVAQATFNQAEAVNAIPVAAIKSVNYSATTTTITVTVVYQPAGLMGIVLVQGHVLTAPTTTVTATAFVCVPGQSGGATQGFCATPSA
jgi:Flp pilus assembly protein TadG